MLRGRGARRGAGGLADERRAEAAGGEAAMMAGGCWAAGGS